MGKGKKSKAAPREAEAEAPAPEPIPISASPLPLLELDAGLLGEFFELCFPDKKLLEICAELRLYSPGYRLENLPPNQVARLLADEVRAAKDAQQLLDKDVREVLRNPVFEGLPLSAAGYRDLIELFTGDPYQHLARIVWRALQEKEPELREFAADAVDLGIQLLDAPSQKAKVPRKPPLPADVQQAQEELRKARSELEEEKKRAERAEKERAAVREQLVQARGETAEREKALAETRTELSQARADLAKATAELSRLTEAGAARAVSDARRTADEARALSERLKNAQAENEELRDRLAALERRLAQSPVAPQPAPQEQEDLPSAEEASTFLVPIFTREFYDSIQRWDRRMQRAAFDKVALLARDWRHGSLRAIALEGVPGYYRIRVATDVRLIYRRGEGNTLEILSLIDREDLDRYVRQARTRPA